MELHPTKEMHLPLSAMIKESSWNGKVNFNNIDFYNWEGKNSKGERNPIIRVNEDGSDYIQRQELEDIRFHNSELEHLTWFFDPPLSWANPADCGDFPCTGPKNTFMSFKRTVFNDCTWGTDGVEITSPDF